MGMFGALGAVVAVIIGAIAWWMRQASTRRRILEFDEGKRCIVCHKTHMTIADDKARCGDCLHVSDLAAMRAAVVTADQIRDATSPRN